MKFRITGLITALLISTFGICLHAEVKVLRVDPQQTDAAIEAVHGPHIALYDPQTASNHRLFVFLSGTKGRAESSLPLDTSFTKWGFHAISLDYEDDVLAVSCAHSPDNACFDHYRDAIVNGAPVSDKVTVTSANSIQNRFQKLLAYLVKQDPEGGWGEFVHHGKPVWNRIVIAGHSQGAGHAAYIAKSFAVDRVLMFSGPQDYFDDSEKPAPWQALKSATSPSRFFAFLNRNDPYNSEHQIANNAVLMGLSKPTPLTVQPDEAIHGDYQILINEETKQAHGSTLFPEFENVWKYMATTTIR